MWNSDLMCRVPVLKPWLLDLGSTHQFPLRKEREKVSYELCFKPVVLLYLITQIHGGTESPVIWSGKYPLWPVQGIAYWVPGEFYSSICKSARRKCVSIPDHVWVNIALLVFPHLLPPKGGGKIFQSKLKKTQHFCSTLLLHFTILLYI